MDLIEVTLACEDTKSKLADTVIVADVDAEKCVTTILCRFGS